MEAKQPITIRIEPKAKKRIVRLARRYRVNASVIVRWAIFDFYHREFRKGKRGGDRRRRADREIRKKAA